MWAGATDSARFAATQVAQLLHTLDSDHDGVLSLAEFVEGLQADNKGMYQLNQPDDAVSSRRYFKTIKFHHPLHNVASMSPLHNFAP